MYDKEKDHRLHNKRGRPLGSIKALIKRPSIICKVSKEIKSNLDKYADLKNVTKVKYIIDALEIAFEKDKNKFKGK